MKTNRLLLFAIALFAFFPFNVFAATEITKLDLIFDEIEEGANPI